MLILSVPLISTIDPWEIEMKIIINEPEIVYCYSSILIYSLILFFIAAVMVKLPSYFAHSKKVNAKFDPYECGIDTSNRKWPTRNHNIKFSLIAMLFLAFDCEVIFLSPFALNIRETTVFQFACASFFALILAIAFVYEMKKRVVE